MRQEMYTNLSPSKTSPVLGLMPISMLSMA